MNVAEDSVSVIYLRLSQFWVVGIMIEHFLTYLFSIKTKREFLLVLSKFNQILGKKH